MAGGEVRMKRVINEFSQAVFNLPWLVAQEEGLFAQEDIAVEFLRARQWDTRRAPEPDPQQVDPFWRHAPFEEREAAAFNACEWGQVHRSKISAVGGRIIQLRAAVACQAIFVPPDSAITHPQALRHKTIAVNFHAGSHYLTLQLLEGFMEREAIRVVHLGQAARRYQAMRDGEVDAAMLMEPYIALAEKQGCHEVIAGFYIGSEMFAPDVDAETAAALNRAIMKAVSLINADKRKYLHHLIADLPPEQQALLTPEDFHLPRLRYVEPRPYPVDEFERTYQWMRSWDLIPEGATYDRLVDARVGSAT
jgi:NitT/TauT family transport system substrate-binding protein